jgi:hypothetical protein
MRNPLMSNPIEHLEGWPHWNHGYDSYEIAKVLQPTFGSNAWLYRWDRVKA